MKPLGYIKQAKQELTYKVNDYKFKHNANLDELTNSFKSDDHAESSEMDLIALGCGAVFFYYAGKFLYDALAPMETDGKLFLAFLLGTPTAFFGYAVYKQHTLGFVGYEEWIRGEHITQRRKRARKEAKKQLKLEKKENKQTKYWFRGSKE
jgi:hypothetical protein